MENPIKCPKCGSTQIHADKKGFSAGKAAAGIVIAGGIGLAAGAIGKNKIIITCLSCGHQFKPGEGSIRPTGSCKSKEIEYKENETNVAICNKCGCKSISSHKYCCGCGKLLDDQDKRTLENIPLPITTCPTCKQMATKSGFFCSKCGNEIKISESNKGCAGVILLFILSIGSLIVML